MTGPALLRILARRWSELAVAIRLTAGRRRPFGLDDRHDAAGSAHSSASASWIAVHDREVGDLAGLDRPDVVREVEKSSRVDGRRPKGGKGREAVAGHEAELLRQVVAAEAIGAHGEPDAALDGVAQVPLEIGHEALLLLDRPGGVIPCSIRSGSSIR